MEIMDHFSSPTSVDKQSWQEHIKNQSERGNDEALASLRKRESFRHKFSKDLLQIDNIQEANHIIKPYLRSTVQRIRRRASQMQVSTP